MQKTQRLLFMLSAFVLISCGQTEKEKQAIEKAKQDSIVNYQDKAFKAKMDSLELHRKNIAYEYDIKIILMKYGYKLAEIEKLNRTELDSTIKYANDRAIKEMTGN